MNQPRPFQPNPSYRSGGRYFTYSRRTSPKKQDRYEALGAAVLVLTVVAWTLLLMS